MELRKTSAAMYNSHVPRKCIYALVFLLFHHWLVGVANGNSASMTVSIRMNEIVTTSELSPTQLKPTSSLARQSTQRHSTALMSHGVIQPSTTLTTTTSLSTNNLRLTLSPSKVLPLTVSSQLLQSAASLSPMTSNDLTVNVKPTTDINTIPSSQSVLKSSMREQGVFSVSSTVRPTVIMTSSVGSLQPTPIVPEQQPKDEEEPYLLIAKRTDIHRLNFTMDTQIETLVGNNTRVIVNAIAIDYDIRQNYMFWTDVHLQLVVRTRLDGSERTVLVNEGLTTPDGLTWDWVNNKLYWTDSGHREIEVFEPSTGHRAQLLHTGPDTIPRALVVDPNKRWLYWTDWGMPAKIERISLDGDPTTRQVLHRTELVWPNALTIDCEAQVIYWADAQLDKIEKSFVDGSMRMIVTTNLIFHPFSLTFYNDSLYWSDWTTNQILTTSLSNPDRVSSVTLPLNERPMGVQIVTESRQPIETNNLTNPCDESNGNCSHLCLLSATSSESQLNFSCLCPVGMMLDTNERDCIEIPSPTTAPPPQPGSCVAAGFTECCSEGECAGSPPNCFCDAFCNETESCCDDIGLICSGSVTDTPPSTRLPFIVFANRGRIYQMELNGTGLDPILTMANNSIALDFDYRNQHVYWSDVTTKAIMRSNLDGSNIVLIVSNLGTPDGLAYEWVTHKLYWTDAQLKTIHVFDIEKRHRRTLLFLGTVTSPRAIVVDPLRRWLYWSDWGDPAKIERCSLDGQNREAIVSSGLVWPNALTIDLNHQILYWADANLDKIESSFVNGSNRQIIIQSKVGVPHPFAITYFDEVLYWTDWSLDGVLSIPLDGSTDNATLLVEDLLTEPMGIQVFTMEKQPSATNPCEVDNGNCSHLCLLSAFNNFTCACPDGFAQGDSPNVCEMIATTEPPTVGQGSCRAAGYDGCCFTGACEGEPSTCFCDIFCFEIGDCCEDFFDICRIGVANTTSTIVSLPTSTQMVQPTTTLSSTSVMTGIATTSLVSLLVTPSSNGRLTSQLMTTNFVTTKGVTKSDIVRPTITKPVTVPAATRALKSTTVLQTVISGSRNRLQPTILSTPITEQPTLVNEGSNFVSVGALVGGLTGAVAFIILLGILVATILVILVVKQRVPFGKYENFENPKSKEMSTFNHSFKTSAEEDSKA